MINYNNEISADNKAVCSFARRIIFLTVGIHRVFRELKLLSNAKNGQIAKLSAEI